MPNVHWATEYSKDYTDHVLRWRHYDIKEIRVLKQDFLEIDQTCSTNLGVNLGTKVKQTQEVQAGIHQDVSRL